MSQSVGKFAQLLTEGVHRIRLREAKTIQVVQDELGYVLGRVGGSAVEYWRKGHIPPSTADIETLAREIVGRGGLERTWLEQFLSSCDYPYPLHLCEQLFPNSVSNGARRSQPGPAAPTSVEVWGSLQTNDSLSTPDFDAFVVGPPIIHPRHFFGRTYELKRIFGLWKRRPLQNVAIIGLKRSGKTSLLHYLKTVTTTPVAKLRPGQQTDWLHQPEQYRWVMVDFRDPRMYRRERLLRYLLLSLDIPVPEPCNLENFLDVVSLHLKNPTLILMDEISSALAAPELDLPFWGSLRSLATSLTGGKLAFLLTAHESPALLAQEQGKPSPFFNIFGHTFTLGPFTEKEARELIASSPRRFDPEDVEWILAQSECWPCRLQALVHARLNALEFGERGDTWKQEGLRQMPPY